MLHLQTRIQLQEVKTSVFGEEILHGPGADVANHLGETYGVLGNTNWSNRKSQRSAAKLRPCIAATLKKNKTEPRITF